MYRQSRIKRARARSGTRLVAMEQFGEVHIPDIVVANEQKENLFPRLFLIKYSSKNHDGGTSERNRHWCVVACAKSRWRIGRAEDCRNRCLSGRWHSVDSHWNTHRNRDSGRWIERGLHVMELTPVFSPIPRAWKHRNAGPTGRRIRGRPSTYSSTSHRSMIPG